MLKAIRPRFSDASAPLLHAPAILLAALLALSPPFVADAAEPAKTAAGSPATAMVEHLALELRVAGIAHALQTANAGICKDLYPQTGLVVRVPPVAVPDAGTAPLPLASMLVPGAAAERAGLLIGDEILAVGDIAAGDVLNPASAFRQAWLAAERSGVLDLTVRTPNAEPRAVTISAAPGCNALFEFVPHDEPNAVTYGNRILVYRGLTDLARSDDELAFVMAHELAHAVLRHSVAGNEAAVRKRSRRFLMEQDADRLGLLLMLNAGFDSSVAGPWNQYFAERSLGRLQKLVGAYGPYMPTDERVRYLDEHSARLRALPRPLAPAAVGLELP